MTRRLVLLRHGRTAWNQAGRIQGQLDAELDDVGRAQAQGAAAALSGLSPAVLWSSDLSRARDTALALSATTGLEPRYDARLREFSLGEREGLSRDDYQALAPEEFAEFRTGHFDVVPGAESNAAVRDRMRAVLSELLEGLEPGQAAIAVSHGAAIRVAVGALLGWPDDQFHTLRGLANCGWVVLDHASEAAGFRMVAYNRTAPPGGDFTPHGRVG